MDDDAGVSAETRANIEYARSQTNLPWYERFTPFANIGALLTMRKEDSADRNWLTFVREEGDPQRLTFLEFADAATRVALYMTDSLGVQTGDRIATLMGNDPQTVLIYFGAWILGATVVPINVAEDDERITYILSNARPRAIFAHVDEWIRASALATRAVGDAATVIQVGGARDDRSRHLQTELECVQLRALALEVTSDTAALIVYTSGTTGPPKGVVLDHGNLLADARSIADWHRFGNADRAMCVLPLHHVNGIVVTLITPLISGGSVTLNRRFRAQSFWHTLAAEHCTWVSVVPTVLAFLCERDDDVTRFDLSAFRHIICGAGPLTVELARRFEQAFHVRVVHGYGLSETTCYSCFLPVDLDEAAHRHWMTECGFPSIGCPISVNEMDIHDPDGNPQQPGVRGEIVARGHNVMCGYFNRPDANRDTFAHGWFRSGDEGYYEIGPGGGSYFFITGRLKELIIRGGVNYSPFDIDEVLSAIPGVKAAMAVGFENDFYGEEVGAYVQLDEHTALSAEAILRACRERLPFAKCPKVVVFGDTFPVTSTGKYQRAKLRPLFASSKGVQFRET